MDPEAFKKAMAEIGQKIMYAHGEKLVELQQKIQSLSVEGLKSGLSAVRTEVELEDGLPLTALGAINPIYDVIMDD
jgi:hypothetical protein